MNSVKLYSNGTAVVRREYAVDGKELKLSIPVRKDDLADVVSSIAVFGRVSLPHPPSYSPKNAVVSRLQIDPENVVQDLAVKLRGGVVRLSLASGRSVSGRLMGRQGFQERSAEGTVERFRIVLQTEEGVASFDDGDVRGIQFDDPTVRAEVDKALDRAFQEIKPESSLVELTILPEPDETTAVVSYAVPVAAWKIRYQLRRTGETWELEGQAVVDNDTDDDWKDVIVSVVSGDPITFDTDLAEIRRPRRSRVNVVSEEAVGAVVMSEAMLDDGAVMMSAPASGGAGKPLMRMRSPSDEGGGAYNRAMPNLHSRLEAARPSRAQQTQADVHAREDGGDFVIFTSPTPISIGAQRSAVIPLFRVELVEARSMLVYKEKDDRHRPYRAVQFRNSTPHPLGMGVCEVFDDGDFVGKAVFRPLRPGEEGFLAHARETGLRVEKVPAKTSAHTFAIAIHDGSGVTQKRNTVEVKYHLWNRLPETATLALEAPWQLGPNAERTVVANRVEPTPDAPSTGGKRAKASKREESIEVKRVRIVDGERLTVELPPRSEVVLRVKDVHLDSATVALAREGAWWLLDMIADPKHALSSHPEVQRLAALRKQILDLRDEISAAEKQAEVYVKEQNRLLKVIQASKGEQGERFQRDLATSEADIRALTRGKIPELEARVKELTKEVADRVAKLAIDWSEATPT